MSRIQKLSSSVVNKIAAGEVVERPASVVKELVENSLDAGATRIDVTVEKGGTELIRVVDNGRGIMTEDIPLAVASHATSKLREAEDLFRVRTLGFRGEALASIAEVSRFLLRSRTADDTQGSELEVVGGESGEVVPCGMPPGTSIEVHNLFFNTPARRKFFRSVQTEMGNVTETLTRLALAHPHVHFTLRHNNRGVFDLPPTNQWKERITRFYGEELADELLWIESQDGPIRLRGYVALPSQSRANARMQYLFLNGRHIRDRSLQHALTESYRGLLLTGRYPIAFLSIEMPPEEVDVNVHPTKMEVRFQDAGRLYSQLLGTLREKFLTSDLTHRLSPVEQESREKTSGFRPSAVGTQAGPERELIAWAKGEVDRWGPLGGNVLEKALPFGSAAGLERSSREMLDLKPLSRSWDSPTVGEAEEPDLEDLARAEESGAFSSESSRFASEEPSRSVGPDFLKSSSSTPDDSYDRNQTWLDRPMSAMQVHNRYLLAESAEGVLVIDQHALHERILYEQIRNKVLADRMESQSLLVPEPVDLAPAEAAVVMEHRELLAQLGLKVDSFGGSTILVSSYPAMLARSTPAEVLRDVVNRLMEEGKKPERRDMLDEMLHMISCKAAIKAGDRLSGEEIDALLAQRHLVQDSHHCPHGRPTALVFTREELDRQFKRT